jgi:hypothetical protein
MALPATHRIHNHFPIPGFVCSIATRIGARDRFPTIPSPHSANFQNPPKGINICIILR